jgi:hypothetical protein
MHWVAAAGGGVGFLIVLLAVAVLQPSPRHCGVLFPPVQLIIQGLPFIECCHLVLVLPNRLASFLRSIVSWRCSQSSYRCASPASHSA